MVLKGKTVKQFSSILFLAALLPLLAASCGKNPYGESADGLTSASYLASDEIFPNPERGFYSESTINNADGRGIATTSMNAARLQGRTLFLLLFNLHDYVTSDISEDYLQTVRARFESLRTGGMKCILRFTYCIPATDPGTAEGLAIYKPWDATPEQVNRHLAQLKPIFQEYKDVIMVVQAGFVGCWGEWYFTDHYTENAPRKALLDALLDAIPSDRQIALRTPGYKRNLFGFDFADTLTRAEAHQPTPKARLAGHNDCFLSSANDVGTYNSPKDRQYWGSESLYTIMGGESCAYTAYSHWEGNDNYNGARKELEINHFTYLNDGYHQKVISRWRKEEFCFEEIQKRLGYRFVLEEGQFTRKAEAGKPFQVVLKLRNDGFAPVQNPREVELVLTDASGKVLKTWPVDSDPRYWMPSQQTTLRQTITLPEGISGDLKLSLNLPDPSENLRNNPFFSIRLANTGVWDENTGYNLLYSFSI